MAEKLYKNHEEAIEAAREHWVVFEHAERPKDEEGYVISEGLFACAQGSNVLVFSAYCCTQSPWGDSGCHGWKHDRAYELNAEYLDRMQSMLGTSRTDEDGGGV